MKKIKIWLSKYIRLVIFIGIFISPVIYMWGKGFEVEKITVVVALLIGLGAILQSLIIRWFLPPLFEVKIKEVFTKTGGGMPQKWYNLSIKNHGFSPAKGVRIKIRDGREKSWINLQRPFASFLDSDDKTTIKNLSPNEENDFNIGHIGLGNYFELSTNIMPNNQVIRLYAINDWIYWLEIITDDAVICPFKIKIVNDGYRQFNASNIKIL